MTAGEDALDLVTDLSRKDVRFLLNGRRACVLHGIPVTTFDYDLWADPDPQNLALLVATARMREFFPSLPLEEMPKTGFFKLENEEKIDVFKVRRFKAPDGRELEFSSAYDRRIDFRDEVKDAVLPVPAIEDLIITKLVGKRKKDIEDVKALMIIRDLQRRP